MYALMFRKPEYNAVSCILEQIESKLNWARPLLLNAAPMLEIVKSNEEVPSSKPRYNNVLKWGDRVFMHYVQLKQ